MNVAERAIYSLYFEASDLLVLPQIDASCVLYCPKVCGSVTQEQTECKCCSRTSFTIGIFGFCSPIENAPRTNNKRLYVGAMRAIKCYRLCDRIYSAVCRIELSNLVQWRRRGSCVMAIYIHSIKWLLAPFEMGIRSKVWPSQIDWDRPIDTHRKAKCSFAGPARDCAVLGVCININLMELFGIRMGKAYRHTGGLYWFKCPYWEIACEC